jgi:hypothetical protein
VSYIYYNLYDTHNFKKKFCKVVGEVKVNIYKLFGDSEKNMYLYTSY